MILTSKDCPNGCTAPSSVVVSRTGGERPGVLKQVPVYRRRECSECGVRWTTYEVTATDLEHNTEEQRRAGYGSVH